MLRGTELPGNFGQRHRDDRLESAKLGVIHDAVSKPLGCRDSFLIRLSFNELLVPEVATPRKKFCTDERLFDRHSPRVEDVTGAPITSA